jgi:hypothetical protein
MFYHQDPSDSLMVDAETQTSSLLANLSQSVIRSEQHSQLQSSMTSVPPMLLQKGHDTGGSSCSACQAMNRRLRHTFSEQQKQNAELG